MDPRVAIILMVISVATTLARTPLLQPTPRCPDYQRPVCTINNGEYRLTLRNECEYGVFGTQERRNMEILHRGPCKEHAETWRGWEESKDDIPASYEDYKKQHPDSKY